MVSWSASILTLLSAWSATIITAPSAASGAQSMLEQIVQELRAEFDLKP